MILSEILEESGEPVESYFGDTLDALLNGVSGAKVYDIDGEKYLIKPIPDQGRPS